MSYISESGTVLVLADLLMGAAYADRRFDGREDATVRAKLAEWLDLPDVPDSLDRHLRNFDPRNFNMKKTAARLQLKDKKEARKVLELVAAVNEADGEIDFDEDEYLRNLAESLGMSKDEYADLGLEIVSVGELREGIRRLSMLPPPLPI